MNIRTLLAALFVMISSPSIQAQTVEQIFNTVFGSGNQNSGQKGTGTSSASGLSNAEIVGGLKEALNIGAKNAGQKLNTPNGYFGNALIKVVMPPEARKVENALRSVGMGSLVDKAILSMNRAAEEAAGKAAPIFINAITSMSIQDGVSILTGGKNAATQFLQTKTSATLTSAFRPVIQGALQKTNATAYWRDVFNVYNKLPTTMNKINPDLTGYVTDRALSGLFTTIADEEAKIRTNPAARVTTLLQKVFGAK